MSSLSSQLKPVVLVASAVVIVISLAWDNAITALINQYIPQEYANSKNAWVKIAYAVFLTIVALLVANYFSI